MKPDMSGTQNLLPGLADTQPREEIVPGVRLVETLDYYRRRGWTVHSLATVPGSLSRWRLLLLSRHPDVENALAPAQLSETSLPASTHEAAAVESMGLA